MSQDLILTAKTAERPVIGRGVEPPDIQCLEDDLWEKLMCTSDGKIESFTAQTKMTFDQAYDGKMSCYISPSSCDGVLSIDNDCVLKGFKKRTQEFESWMHVRSVLTVTVEVPPRSEIGLSIGATMIKPFFPKSFEIFTDRLLEVTVYGQRAKPTSYNSLLHMSSSVDTKQAAKSSRHGIDQFGSWSGNRLPRREWYYIIGVDVFDQDIKYVNANVHLRSDIKFKCVPHVSRLDRPRLPEGITPRELVAMDDRASKFCDLYLASKTKETENYRSPPVNTSSYLAKSNHVGSHPLPPPIAKPAKVVVVREPVPHSCDQPVYDRLTDRFSSLVVQDIPTNCGKCAMCDTMASMTKHHLIPKEVHNRCRLPKAVMDKTINICRPCHDAIHRFHTNAELALEFSTIERLIDLAKVNGRVCRQIAINVSNVQEFAYVGSEGMITIRSVEKMANKVPQIENDSPTRGEAVDMNEVRGRARRVISHSIVPVPMTQEQEVKLIELDVDLMTADPSDDGFDDVD